MRRARARCICCAQSSARSHSGAAIQLYTQRNQWREVITADLERAFEEATGRSLARFFEQWLYKAGHPEFKVRYSWDDEHKHGAG